MTDEYIPIPCAVHDQLERYVLENTPLRLTYQDENGEMHILSGMAADVYTRAGEEFLRIRVTQGGEERIRLDRIRSILPMEE